MANLELLSWGGFLAPKGTPHEIIGRLNREIGRIVRDSATRSDLGTRDGKWWRVHPEEFAKLIEIEQAKWARLVKPTGIRAEQ